MSSTIENNSIHEKGANNDNDSHSSSSTARSNYAREPQTLTAADAEAASLPDEELEEDNSNLARIETKSEVSREISRVLTMAKSTEEYNKEFKTPVPSMGLGKELPTEYPDKEAFTVSFNGPDDPAHPHNWPLKTKVFLCACIGFNTATIAWGSSIFSSATLVIAAKYHVGEVVAILSTSLYVLGFALGPVVWAPLSELYGRKPILILSLFGFTCFNFAAATAENLQTILLGRFFSGALGASPLVVVPAAFADLFNSRGRGKAITIFSMTVFCMPIIAPVAGSFITNSYLGWRWTEYITGIMGAFGTLLTVFFFKETHHPIILVEKANEIKKRTGNWLIHAPHDEFELDIKEIVEKNLTRPIVLLVKEPIILLVSIFNSFIYGILYLLLSAYPIVFAEGYKFHGGVAELPYLAVAIGMVCGGVCCIFLEDKYIDAMEKNNGKPVPEARLYPMIFGSFAFPIGLMWFTWAGNYHEHVHWMVPTVAGVFIGFGLITIFNSSINYIIDSYLIFAASALAGNSFLRAIFACCFPLFSNQMFHNLGTNWAGLLLACVGFVLIPVPFLFLRYGKSIRAKSKYAFVLS
ncbi:hypothetical protein WICMUC_001951 [Wickerhamomyces mucosus]|uniref:Major facilitator superfamily (MFS) profile domain-containing protein n=1 Tax=Wickerhamomyces mucosus TaxID=1378264 RepID=A0A9P8TFU2_9ASCO|nr:hypothetical protein WICMUC_001951 [Wickerhamomyces mucosus]